MVVIKCPSCEKEVTVPPGARVESRVRCPMCDAEHSLQELLKDLPPLLILLEAPQPAADAHGSAPMVLDDVGHPQDADTVLKSADDHAVSPANGGIFKFGDESSDSAEHGDFSMSDPEERTAPNSFDFGEGGGTATAIAAETATGTGTRSATARPRRKKPAANPMMEIVKVIMGGVIALPIAQLILWWLPGEWKRDPMNLAPQLPSYVAFLAPASLRDVGSVEETPEKEKEAANFVAPQPEEEVGEVPKGNSFGRDDLAAALAAHNKENGKGDDVEETPPKDGPNEVPFGIDAPDLGNNPKPKPNEKPENGEIEIESPVDVSPKPFAGPKDAPTYQSADLKAPLEAAKAVANNLTDAGDSTLDPAERVKKINDFKGAMFNLAHHVSYAPNRSAGYNEHLDELLGQVAAVPKNLNALGNLAQQRLDEKQRTGDGVVLVGNVKSIEPRGQLFETIVELNTKTKRPVSIYGAKDPSAAMKDGELVIILGAIISDPREKLSGYNGPDEPIVWGGFSHVVD